MDDKPGIDLGMGTKHRHSNLAHLILTAQFAVDDITRRSSIVHLI